MIIKLEIVAAIITIVVLLIAAFIGAAVVGIIVALRDAEDPIYGLGELSPFGVVF